MSKRFAEFVTSWCSYLHNSSSNPRSLIVGTALGFLAIKNEFQYQPYTSHLGFDDRRHTSRVRHGIFLELRPSIGKISISICWRTFRIDRVEQTYLARIEQINGVLNAIAEVNPDAIEIALERDREREEGRLRG